MIVTGRREEPLHAVAGDTGGLAVAGDADRPGARGRRGGRRDRRLRRPRHRGRQRRRRPGGSAGDVTDDDWRTTLDVNLTGAMRLVRAAMPALAGGGEGLDRARLVGLGLRRVELERRLRRVEGRHDRAHRSRSRSTAGRSGVRANALCPGWVRTPMGDDAMDELATGRGTARRAPTRGPPALVPLRRAAEPSEIAACALFLASDDVLLRDTARPCSSTAEARRSTSPRSRSTRAGKERRELRPCRTTAFVTGARLRHRAGDRPAPRRRGRSRRGRRRPARRRRGDGGGDLGATSGRAIADAARRPRARAGRSRP